ncbi:MAG: AI-2E family transporter [Verrucomicrobiaceae bacterium]|nr:AI-2E family transporter [Verrucomicrobiaceae bacterium]
MTHEPEPTTHTDWSQQGHRTLLALACLIVVFTGMKLAASLMVPIALAFFLAVLSYPLVRWLVRWRVPRSLAMLLTVLLIFGTLAGLVNSGIRLIVRFQSDLPESKSALQKNIDGAAAWLEQQGIEGAAKTAKDMLNPDSIIDYLTQENVMTTIGGVLGSTFGTVAVFGGAVFMVLIVMIFILVEAHGTEGRILAIKLAGGPDLSSLMQSVSDIQKYLGIKTAISLGAGVCVGIWCWALDLQYPLLWAIIAFLFHFIPAVGAWLAAIPAIIDGLVQSGWGSAFGVALGFVIINVSFDSFLQPMLLGRRFGISTLVIVLSVVFWGWLWGPVGMFLAVPLTMVFKVLLDNSAEFRWLSVAMSKKKVVGTEVQLADYDLDIEDADLIGAGATTESPGRR